MIRSFRDKDTEKVYIGQFVSRFSPEVRRAAQRKMTIIALVLTRGDLNVPPGNRLEKLKGDRDGQYSIRVNDQWRLCFLWDAPNADDVELTDYH